MLGKVMIFMWGIVVLVYVLNLECFSFIRDILWDLIKLMFKYC